LYDLVIRHRGYPEALAYLIAASLGNQVFNAVAMSDLCNETLAGHPGIASMFAAMLAAPWSMLVAGLAPPLPRDWPLVAGLAVRVVPLALFMLVNAAIVRGIAARSERDLTRTVTRAGVLLLFLSPLFSGCILSTRQEVFVAAPKVVFLVFSGGMEETYCSFDLTTSPQWVEHRGDLVRITDLAIVGDFRNATGGLGGLPVPIDVKIAVSPDPLPSLTQGIDTWGAVHIDTLATRHIDWAEGHRLMIANASALEREIRGDGKFTLYTITVPRITLNGSVSVDHLNVMAVFELK